MAWARRFRIRPTTEQIVYPSTTFTSCVTNEDEMDDNDGATTGWLSRLRNHFGGNDDTESSEKPFWKRYGAWFQLLVLVATAFGGAIVGFASTAATRTTGFLRTSGTELLNVVFPILVGVTLIAVVVCLVVVTLSVRNV
jgi:hypothetical protein